MCGIGGFFLKEIESNFHAMSTLELMNQRMSKRGPDSNGTWLLSRHTVGICHTRLSIIDVDNRSKQPMTSLCGRYVITFNGEIYNYKKLRKSLLAKGVRLRTKSDTEVILELFALYGHTFFNELQGMFAFAVYDIKNNSFIVTRDPYGIKPLYISKCKNGWAFASQVKALIDSKLVSKSPSPSGQFGFWLYGSVPEPYTWYENITALQPGTWISINCEKISSPVVFNNISKIWSNANPSSLLSSESEVVFSKAIRDSINSHLVSDVPVGLFLSGGVDSGALAGVMSETVENAHAFTLKFDEFNDKNDESIHAALIAKKYEMKHQIRVVNKKEFDNDIDTIFHDMDQPTIDGFNTWYVSKAASEHDIKVCLSGIGADEILCGYPSFSNIPLFQSIWNNASKYGKLTNLIKLVAPYLFPKFKSQRICTISSEPVDLISAYWIQRGLYSPMDVLPINYDLFNNLKDVIPSIFLENYFDNLPDSSALSISLLESRAYLRNQLLRDCDWASMAHGVELRTPFVDAKLISRIVDLIPKFNNNGGKKILSNTPKMSLPIIIQQKEKTGFGIPVSSWIGKGNTTLINNKKYNEESPSMLVAKFVAENY